MVESASILETLHAHDLGRMAFEPAYNRQCAEVERVLAARETSRPIAGTILLVEHAPVITISQRPTARRHLTATPEALAGAGVRVVETDRGGDITYHGPGQLVVYPILDLNALGLRLHEYMRLLENALIEVCRGLGMDAGRDTCATGVWVRGAKVCAMGVRVRRWVSMHGLALNVNPDLRHFDLIVPCGLAGRGVTSLQRELGAACPAMPRVKDAVVQSLRARLHEHVSQRAARPTRV